MRQIFLVRNETLWLVCEPEWGINQRDTMLEI